MKNKLIKFEDEFAKEVQDYANKNHDGKFVVAARELIKAGLESKVNKKG